MPKRQNVVLIVDDTPENLRVLGELLETEGHEVRVATNGTHGIEIARSSEVDLILLDIMMPEMDGYEVCRKLKRTKQTKAIPVIFLTALDSADDEAKGLGLGAVDYITKPFKLELVVSRVANQLALHNARQELQRHNTQLEELVAERSKELAEAHQRLLTVDSAKYDFLQLIYQRIWAPEKGIIDLSRRALARLDSQDPEATKLKTRYEESQAELFDTINNALLMAGTHLGDASPDRHPIRVEALVEEAMAKWAPEAQARGLHFQGGVGNPSLALGDLDLVYQVFLTVVHAVILVARPGSTVTLGCSETSSEIRTDWRLEELVDTEGDLATLFDEGRRFHPSEAGKILGLAIPLGLKIVRTLGGRVTLTPVDGGWTLRTTLPRFAAKAGVRIAL